MAFLSPPAPVDTLQIQEWAGAYGQITLDGTLYDHENPDLNRRGNVTFISLPKGAPKSYSGIMTNNQRLIRFVSLIKSSGHSFALPFQMFSGQSSSALTVSSWTETIDRQWAPSPAVSVPDGVSHAYVAGYATPIDSDGRIVTPRVPSGNIEIRERLYLQVKPTDRRNVMWSRDRSNVISVSLDWIESGRGDATQVSNY